MLIFNIQLERSDLLWESSNTSSESSSSEVKQIPSKECNKYEWLIELSNLTKIATSEPHAAAAYCGFVHSFKHKLTYILRTVPCGTELLSLLEDLIWSSNECS